MKRTWTSAHQQEILRFFHIAMGSVRECQAILELAAIGVHPAAQELDTIVGSLYCLIKAAKRKLAAEKPQRELTLDLVSDLKAEGGFRELKTDQPAVAFQRATS